LLCSSASRAAAAGSTFGTSCLINRSPGLSNTICDYAFKQPFVLKGYSRGGSSTLTYDVRCGKVATWPLSSAVIERRVWYKHSTTVKGRFAVYGSKGTFLAAGHCLATRGTSPVLTVMLKMGEGVTKTSLAVRLDESLPWAD
jgi:hypothetical protein